MTTPWKPVVIGVDASATAAEAAAAGWAIARQAGVPARLVHATPDAWTIPAIPHSFSLEPGAVNRAAREVARVGVEAELSDQLPAEAVETLEVRTGRAAAVLRDVVDQADAGLVVLGGKHHSTLGRWVVGSTAHTLVRTLDIPLLVTARHPWPIQRVMAAVDLSDAADPTVKTAARFAELLGADLHVLHVVEPLPILGDMPLGLSEDDVYDHARRYLEEHLWPHLDPGVTTGMRRGGAPEAIAAEVADRGVNLVILGSHGKGWVDRILIGSVTERVLSALPTSLLVVPVVGPTSGRKRRAAGGGDASAHRPLQLEA